MNYTAEQYLDRIENKRLNSTHLYSREEMIDFAERYAKAITVTHSCKSDSEQLSLCSFSQQRELLLAYEKSQYETTWCMSEAEATNRINDFLANNCG